MAVDLRGQWQDPYPFWNASTEAPAERLRADLDLLPRPAEAGRVAALGLPAHTGPVCLLVGGVEQRKNTPRLLHAFARLRRSEAAWADARLVVAGGASLLEAWSVQRLAARAEAVTTLDFTPSEPAIPMPAMHDTLQWLDATQSVAYSPSRVIQDYLQPGTDYPLADFMRRIREATAIADQRVEARFGFVCSRAGDQLRDTERRATAFALQALDGDTLRFAPQLGSAPDQADRIYNGINAAIEQHIAEKGLDAPAGGVYEPVWGPRRSAA